MSSPFQGNSHSTQHTPPSSSSRVRTVTYSPRRSKVPVSRYLVPGPLRVESLSVASRSALSPSQPEARAAQGRQRISHAAAHRHSKQIIRFMEKTSFWMYDIMKVNHCQ